MKKLLSLLLVPFVALAQVNVQKTSGDASVRNRLSNGSLIVGNSVSITAEGTGSIVATSVAPGGATPWATLTSIPSPTITLNGDAAATLTLLASGGITASVTLATVNSNVGSFGSSTAIPVLTVNGKGLLTAVSTVAVIAPAGTLTGTTLASNVVSSSLTSVGTIASGTWQGTVLGSTYGGTGVNNGSATLTMAGSHVLSGAFASTFTFTGATGVTFPTSGTLATTAGTVASITGTANQVLANATSGSAQTGAVTLTLPQSIATTSAVTFASVIHGGSAGAGYAEFANQSVAPSTPTSAGRLYWDSTNRLSWIGTNGFTRTFDGTANTANRTYVLPDVSSTFVMLANPTAGVSVTNVNSLTAASATALTFSGGATSGNVVINTNGSTLAATFSGANTTLAGTLYTQGFDINSAAIAYTNASTTNSFLFTKSGGVGGIGELGSGEINYFYNFDYTSGIHRLFDNTKNAWSTTISPILWSVQLVAASVASGDLPYTRPFEIFPTGNSVFGSTTGGDPGDDLGYKVNVMSAGTTGVARFGTGSSGVTPFSPSTVVIENNGRTVLSLLSPAANDAYLMFGSTTHNNQAWLGYSFATDTMTLRAANATQVTITSGNVTLAGTLGTAGAITTTATGTNITNVISTTSSGSAPEVGLQFLARSASNAGSRNWALAMAHTSIGDFQILRSTTNSGLPTTVALSFDGSGNLTQTANVTVSGTGASTLGAAGSVFTYNGAVASTSTSTGTVVISGAGGLGVGGAAYFGGVGSFAGTLTVAANGGINITARSQTAQILNDVGGGVIAGSSAGALDFVTTSGEMDWSIDNGSTRTMYLRSTGLTLASNATFSTTGTGLSLHGAGTITGASGDIIVKTVSGQGFYVKDSTNATTFTLLNTGAATFAGSLTATTGTFSGNITSTATTGASNFSAEVFVSRTGAGSVRILSNSVTTGSIEIATLSGGVIPYLKLDDAGNTTGAYQWEVGRGSANKIALRRTSGTAAELASWSSAGDLINLGNFTVNGTTASTSTTTGALVVTGGAGFGGALNAGGTITTTSAQGTFTATSTNGSGRSYQFYSDNTGTVGVFDATGSTNVWSSTTATMTVARILAISNTTAATAYNAASVTVAGGLGVAGDVIIKSGQFLQLGSTYTAGVQVNTGYITVKDATGTTYKVNVNL